MKKIFLLFAVAVVSVAAMAQTDFRHISFAEAQKAAQQEKKLIFVDFYTSWCGPCKQMAREVFPQKEVGEFMNKKFVCVKYDAEKEELDLVNRSNITAYPTFIIFNADGTEVNRKVGGASADVFVADMERLSNADLTPEKIVARYEAGERTAILVKAYAALLREEAYNSRSEYAAKMQKIPVVVNDYFAGLSDKEKLSANNLFLYKDHCRNTGDAKMQFLFANRDRAPKALRADIDTILVKAYTMEAMKRVGFYEPFAEGTYPLFREQAMNFKEMQEPQYSGVIEILDAYVSGDMSKYVDVVTEQTETKCKKNSFTILYGMSTALEKADKEVKLRAAKLIRSKLNDMSGTNISFIGTTIADLEGTSNRH